MFESTLLESTTAVPLQNRWTALVSFTTQGLLVAALLAVPLFQHSTLTTRSFPMDLARPAPIVLPQPVPRVRLTTTPIATTAPVASQEARIQRFPQPGSGPSPAIPSIDLTGGNNTPAPLALGNGSPSSPNIGIVSEAPSRGAASNNPQVVSTGISAGLLLEPIQPKYPQIAIMAHQDGVVTVEAIISTIGHVESAHAVSGPAMLQRAAVEAVRNARYRPFQLNGKPTEVAATFSIHFNLGGQ